MNHVSSFLFSITVYLVLSHSKYQMGPFSRGQAKRTSCICFLCSFVSLDQLLSPILDSQVFTESEISMV